MTSEKRAITKEELKDKLRLIEDITDDFDCYATDLWYEFATIENSDKVQSLLRGLSEGIDKRIQDFNSYIAALILRQANEEMKLVAAEMQKINESVESALPALKDFSEAIQAFESAQPKKHKQLHSWDKKQMRGKPFK